MEALDCGHRADRPAVTYCNNCIEGLVARAERAEALVKRKEQELSDLVLAYRALLAKTEIRD